MRNRILVLSLLIICALSLTAYGATKARNITGNTGITEAVAMGDASSGDTVEVDSDGSQSIKEYAKDLVAVTADGAAVTGTARMYTVVYAPSKGCSFVNIYAGTTGSSIDTLKLTIRNYNVFDSKVIEIPGGANMRDGIYVDFDASGAGGGGTVSIGYDAQ